MPDVAPSRVFISYRRREASGMAGRLYDRLAARFGDDQVFMDVDAIALGVDFAKVITQAVSRCEVLLAVIGPDWLTVTGDDGQRRLDDPDDLVRLEIAAALARDIPVIPILVEGARLPRRQELPENLASLPRRNGLSVRHESFRADADRLLAAIERILRDSATAVPLESSHAETVPAAVKPAEDGSSLTQVQILRHPADVRAAAFSPDGWLLATACGDNQARVWEVASGQQRTRVTHDSMVRGVVFSPDGRLLATASLDKTARVWEVASGRERLRVRHKGWGVYGVAFSPDGRLLATVSFDKTARVWEVASGQQRTRMKHRSYLSGVDFSPDGRLLATANIEEHTARMYDVASGQQRAQVTHDGGVYGVAFSPDGRLLATASVDKTARVWEVASGQPRAQVSHNEEVMGVAFSPDGRLLATASKDDTARIWALDR